MAETSDTETATDERAQLRAGLLDQLRHLVREVDMLEGVIGRVPPKLLNEAPPNEPNAISIKEIFGLTARLDEAVHSERVARLVAEDTPRFPPPDEAALLEETDWNTLPVATLFERVRAARSGFVEALEAVAPADWPRTGLFPEEQASGPAASGNDEREERDLYWMAHGICGRDAARLEGITRRLYESHMGDAP